MDTIEKRIQAYLSKIPKQKVEKVELSLITDADKIYDGLVKGSQRQVAILRKVEAQLNKLEGEAKRLLNLEQKIEQQAKELGVDIDQLIEEDYAASTWVSDLNKYANRIGEIASVL
jgi:hypothetical protein